MKNGRKISLIGRAVALAKRNPLSTVAVVVGIFAGIPGAVAGVNYLNAAAEAWTPAFVPDVTVTIDGKKIPVIVLALEQNTTLDYLILKDQRQALKEAKEDMAKAPNETTRRALEQLERSINKRQERLDRATGGR